jgi:hypothetical protein
MQLVALETPTRPVKRPFIARFFRDLNLRQDRASHHRSHKEQSHAEGREKERRGKGKEVIVDGDRIMGNWRQEKLQG